MHILGTLPEMGRGRNKKIYIVKEKVGVKTCLAGMFG
jgi:hypothetical protein